MKVVELLHTLARATAVGGAGVVGYYFGRPLINMFNADYHTYLIKTDANHVNETIALNDDYFCFFSTQEEDDDCRLYDLGTNDKHYIDGENIANTTEEITGTLKKVFFYKLVVNKTKIKNNFLNKEISIKRVNKNEEEKESNKNTFIAKATVISEIFPNKLKKIKTWNRGQILVQAKTSVFSATELKNIKCFLSDDTEVNCKIFKFNDSSHKHLFDFSKIKDLTNIEEIQSQQYYVLDFSGNRDGIEKNKLNIQSNIDEITIKDNDTAKVKLKFVSKIFGILEDVPSVTVKKQAVIFSTNFGANTNNSTYIIAQSVNNSGGNFKALPKNYKCKTSSGEKFDESCSIIELTEADKTLQLITASDKNTDNTSLKTADKYFKIIVNNQILQQLNSSTWDGEQKLKIVGNGTDSTEFGELKALFLVEGNRATKGKSNFVIATAEEEITGSISSIDENTQYQCKTIDSSSSTSSAANCDVYKFSIPQPNIEDIEKQINGEITKANKSDDWKQKNVFLINLDSQKIDHSNSSIKVSVKISSANDDIATLKINSHLFNMNKTFDSKDISSLLLFR